MEAITVERTLNAPIDRVWRAWTDPEQLCPWFALRANVAPKRGGPYERFWDLDDPERQSHPGMPSYFHSSTAMARVHMARPEYIRRFHERKCRAAFAPHARSSELRDKWRADDRPCEPHGLARR
jgi:hypothetical protein